MEKTNPVGSLLKVRTHPEILKLFVAWFFGVFGMSHAVQTNWAYILRCTNLFGTKNSRDFSRCDGIFTAFCSRIFLIRKVHPKLGSERSILYGIMFYCTGMLLFAFASKRMDDVRYFSHLLS